MMVAAVERTYNTKDFALFRHAYQGILLDEWVLELHGDPTVKATSMPLKEGAKGGKDWMCTLSHEGGHCSFCRKERHESLADCNILLSQYPAAKA
ncbi:hypothetical protein LZ554_005198 [Drepanopeziza brunnea f. sp. 'monogermtubi']|nr:hypothetical protein LZ554_005198 [Drepanopeziza brunnea f. sp. 'monogermtubi']